jgi:acyl-CoA thioesterase I
MSPAWEGFMIWKALLAGVVIAFGIEGFSPATAAESLRIVALGASNTYGAGVSRKDAYPAQLEALLRAEGLDVTVKNEGIELGQTTDEMLEHLPSTVPQGTHIVILQPGGHDGMMANAKELYTAQTVSRIVATLRERHIEVLIIGGPNLRGPELRELADKYDALVAPSLGRIAPSQRQNSPKGDQGHLQQHFTPAGYRMIAERLLPLVKQLVARIHER